MGLIKLALLGVGVLFIGIVLGLIVLPSFVSDIVFRNVQYSPAEEFVTPNGCSLVKDEVCVVQRIGRNFVEHCQKLVCEEEIVFDVEESPRPGERCRESPGFVECTSDTTGRRCSNGYWYHFVCPAIGGGSSQVQLECIGGDSGGCGI